LKKTMGIVMKNKARLKDLVWCGGTMDELCDHGHFPASLYEARAAIARLKDEHERMVTFIEAYYKSVLAGQQAEIARLKDNAVPKKGGERLQWNGADERTDSRECSFLTS